MRWQCKVVVLVLVTAPAVPMKIYCHLGWPASSVGGQQKRRKKNEKVVLFVNWLLSLTFSIGRQPWRPSQSFQSSWIQSLLRQLLTPKEKSERETFPAVAIDVWCGALTGQNLRWHHCNHSLCAALITERLLRLSDCWDRLQKGRRGRRGRRRGPAANWQLKFAAAAARRPHILSRSIRFHLLIP